MPLVVVNLTEARLSATGKKKRQFLDMMDRQSEPTFQIRQLKCNFDSEGLADGDCG